MRVNVALKVGLLVNVSCVCSSYFLGLLFVVSIPVCACFIWKGFFHTSFCLREGGKKGGGVEVALAPHYPEKQKRVWCSDICCDMWQGLLYNEYHNYI